MFCLCILYCLLKQCSGPKKILEKKISQKNFRIFKKKFVLNFF
jgi:hypothetical protein